MGGDRDGRSSDHTSPRRTFCTEAALFVYATEAGRTAWRPSPSVLTIRTSLTIRSSPSVILLGEQPDQGALELMVVGRGTGGRPFYPPSPSPHARLEGTLFLEKLNKSRVEHPARRRQGTGAPAEGQAGKTPILGDDDVARPTRLITARSAAWG